jgi:hypothetical protein
VQQPVVPVPAVTASTSPPHSAPAQYPTVVRTTIAAGPQARTVAVSSSLAGGAVPTIVVIGLFCALASAALRILPRLRAPNVRTRR